MMTVLDLFSGIGGFSLGLERTGGFRTVAFCEIEPFPRRVLAKHWPEVPIYEDVRTLTAARLAADGIGPINVITGGFPCQDISVAGKRAGLAEGTRSGLWSEIVRLAGELRPDFVIVENVANLLRGPSERPGGWFGRVLGDLAECGYDAEWENIPASALGAPHRRERIWVVAYANQTRFQTPRPKLKAARVEQRRELGGVMGLAAVMAEANSVNEKGQQSSIVDQKERARQVKRQIGPRIAGIGGQWVTEPDICRVAHGIPDRSHRLAALGNAVVPQIPELIGRAILEAVG